MKSVQDPRHIRRIHTMQGLFQFSYNHNGGGDYGFVNEIIPELTAVDDFITKSAPEWPLEKLNRIDLAILRLAIFELLKKEAPDKVVIDEAVELAKQYGADNSPRFINGALGAALKFIHPEATPDVNS